jgi:hypothetical protein
MQIVLLLITVFLSIILYKLLSSNRATYPFIRTTRLERTEDNSEYLTTEAEEGLITIDKDVVIVEGNEYSLKAQKGSEAQAYLTIDNGKLVSISIRSANGEKLYFIDPEHSLYANPYTDRIRNSHSHRHIFSF